MQSAEILLAAKVGPATVKTLVDASVDLSAEHAMLTRVELLQRLKELGVLQLGERQRIANTLGKAARGQLSSTVPAVFASEPSVLASEPSVSSASDPPLSSKPVVIGVDHPHLFLSPWNWGRSAASLACTANPGAYLKLEWLEARGPNAAAADSAAAPVLVVDTSASTKPFMVIAYSIDGWPQQLLLLPHGETHARLVLESQPASSVDVSDNTPSCGSADDDGHVDRGARVVRSLVVGVDRSVQAYDRWGDGPAKPPACSLRLREVILPAGSVTRSPTSYLRPRRMLAFGCSTTEGVSAGVQPGMRVNDLLTNCGTRTWVDAAARRLDAEYGSVGFGRHAFLYGGNGNVPAFSPPPSRLAGTPHARGPWRGHPRSHRPPSGEAAASWEWVWSGVPRDFSASHHGAAPGMYPDLIFVVQGTNDAIVGGREGVSVHAAVVDAVASWLSDARQAVGTSTHIFLVVPFGGFGGPANEPRGALSEGFARYRREHSADDRAHLIDLGPEARQGLDGFRIVNGRYAPSDESCDGIHPTATRHHALGVMLADAALQVLGSHCDG